MGRGVPPPHIETPARPVKPETMSSRQCGDDKNGSGVKSARIAGRALPPVQPPNRLETFPDQNFKPAPARTVLVFSVRLPGVPNWRYSYSPRRKMLRVSA